MEQVFYFPRTIEPFLFLFFHPAEGNFMRNICFIVSKINLNTNIQSIILTLSLPFCFSTFRKLFDNNPSETRFYVPRII